MGEAMTSSSSIDYSSCPSTSSPKGIDRRGLLFGAAAVAAAAGVSSASAQTAVCSDPQVGSIWWNELVAADPIEVRAFYTKVMGWTAKVVAMEDTSRPPNPGEEEYTLFLSNGQEVAGLTKPSLSDPIGLRPGWFSYVQVASVDDAVKETLKSGGKVLRFPIDLPKVGRIAVIEDPAGTQIGLVTPITVVPG